MEINKWLKELGLTWYDLPGNYIPKTSLKIRLKRRWYKIKRGICFMFSSFENKAPKWNEKYEYIAYEKSNKVGKDGFCDYEFYSLDYTMSLYIYPRLCEFRYEYAKYGTPSCLCCDENGKDYPDDTGHEKWIEILDKMILAFRYIIKEPVDKDLEEIDKVIKEGLELFGKYYLCLWW